MSRFLVFKAQPTVYFMDVQTSTYCRLGGDVSAAHYFGTSQRFLTLCSLPE